MSDSDNLNVIAKKNKMFIIDTPSDGNCLFFAICHYLKKYDVAHLTCHELRNKLAEYMRASDNLYRDFVCGLITCNDPCNADTEHPTLQDNIISTITDVETRKEIQWLQYLENLANGSQWGSYLIHEGLLFVIE